jgi:cytochrome b6-f complex iron-sulfur subunit
MMPTKDAVKKVWITQGCIACDICETACSEIFNVAGESAVIKPEASEPTFTHARTDAIFEAATACPVEVIQYETETIEVPDPALAAAIAAGGDPQMQALLHAATQRGGRERIDAALAKRREAARTVAATVGRDPAPDARFASILGSAKPEPEPVEAEEVDDEEDMSRRNVLVAWLAMAAVGGLSAIMFQRFMFPNVSEEDDPRIRVGPLDKYAALDPGTINEDYKPDGVWLLRTEEQLVAINIICTHLGCIPNWLPNDHKFKCPCHGSGFRQNGINFEGPAPRPLERFKISVTDGLVLVDKSKHFQYEKGQWDNPESYLGV